MVHTNNLVPKLMKTKMTINKKVRGKMIRLEVGKGAMGPILLHFKFTLKGATSIHKLSACVKVAGFTNKKAVFGALFHY